jgi:predicted small metal-binding protein
MHAVKDHGYTEEDIMTPEMKEKIKSHIRKS